MSLFLQKFTGIFFYLLTGSYFLGYLFYRNAILGPWPAWWMQVADLPLALFGVLYGGSSFYRTIHKGEHASVAKIVTIAIPLALIFSALFVLNFWVVLGLPVSTIKS
jgi:hypothetical protein